MNENDQNPDVSIGLDGLPNSFPMNHEFSGDGVRSAIADVRDRVSKLARLAAANGDFLLPHQSTYNSQVEFASKTYWSRFDEALRFGVNDALAMRRDPFVHMLIRHRQTPTALLEHTLFAGGGDDAEKRKTVEQVRRVFESTPRFQTMKMILLEAVFYGKSGVELSFKEKWIDGRKYFVVDDFRAIQGDKIIFKYDGTPGIFVYPKIGSLIKDSRLGLIEQADLGPALFLKTKFWRRRFIIHEFEPTDTDYLYEADMGGSIHGVGLRGRLFWGWYQRKEMLAWAFDAMQRISTNGALIGYYPSGNDEAKTAMVDALKSVQQYGFAVAAVEPSMSGAPSNSIQHIEPAAIAYDVLMKFIEYQDSILRQAVLGQDLSTSAAPTGLGSGVAELQGQVRSDFILYDANNLAERIEVDLLQTLIAFNSWDYAGRVYNGWLPFDVKFKFVTDRQDVDNRLKAAQTMVAQLGIDIDKDNLLEEVGFSAPRTEEASVLKSMQAAQSAMMQPAQGQLPPPGQGPPPADAEMPQEGEEGQEAGPESQAMPPTQEEEDDGRIVRYALGDQLGGTATAPAPNQNAPKSKAAPKAAPTPEFRKFKETPNNPKLDLNISEPIAIGGKEFQGTIKHGTPEYRRVLDHASALDFEDNQREAAGIDEAHEIEHLQHHLRHGDLKQFPAQLERLYDPYKGSEEGGHNYVRKYYPGREGGPADLSSEEETKARKLKIPQDVQFKTFGNKTKTLKAGSTVDRHGDDYGEFLENADPHVLASEPFRKTFGKHELVAHMVRKHKSAAERDRKAQEEAKKNNAAKGKKENVDAALKEVNENRAAAGLEATDRFRAAAEGESIENERKSLAEAEGSPRAARNPSAKEAAATLGVRNENKKVGLGAAPGWKREARKENALDAEGDVLLAKADLDDLHSRAHELTDKEIGEELQNAVKLRNRPKLRSLGEAFGLDFPEKATLKDFMKGFSGSVRQAAEATKSGNPWKSIIEKNDEPKKENQLLVPPKSALTAEESFKRLKGIHENPLEHEPESISDAIHEIVHSQDPVENNRLADRFDIEGHRNKEELADRIYLMIANRRRELLKDSEPSVQGELPGLKSEAESQATTAAEPIEAAKPEAVETNEYSPMESAYRRYRNYYENAPGISQEQHEAEAKHLASLFKSPEDRKEFAKHIGLEGHGGSGPKLQAALLNKVGERRRDHARQIKDVTEPKPGGEFGTSNRTVETPFPPDRGNAPLNKGDAAKPKAAPKAAVPRTAPEQPKPRVPGNFDKFLPQQVFNRVVDEETKKGTPLEKAREIATKAYHAEKARLAQGDSSNLTAAEVWGKPEPKAVPSPPKAEPKAAAPTEGEVAPRERNRGPGRVPGTDRETTAMGTAYELPEDMMVGNRHFAAGTVPGYRKGKNGRSYRNPDWTYFVKHATDKQKALADPHYERRTASIAPDVKFEDNPTKPFVHDVEPKAVEQSDAAPKADDGSIDRFKDEVPPSKAAEPKNDQPPDVDVSEGATDGVAATETDAETASEPIAQNATEEPRLSAEDADFWKKWATHPNRTGWSRIPTDKRKAILKQPPSQLPPLQKAALWEMLNDHWTAMSGKKKYDLMARLLQEQNFPEQKRLTPIAKEWLISKIKSDSLDLQKKHAPDELVPEFDVKQFADRKNRSKPERPQPKLFDPDEVKLADDQGVKARVKTAPTAKSQAVLEPKNPFDADNTLIDRDTFDDAAIAKAKLTDKEKDNLDRFLKSHYAEGSGTAISDLRQFVGDDATDRLIQSLGYDGIDEIKTSKRDKNGKRVVRAFLPTEPPEQEPKAAPPKAEAKQEPKAAPTDSPMNWTDKYIDFITGKNFRNIDKKELSRIESQPPESLPPKIRAWLDAQYKARRENNVKFLLNTPFERLSREHQEGLLNGPRSKWPQEVQDHLNAVEAKRNKDAVAERAKAKTDKVEPKSPARTQESPTPDSAGQATKRKAKYADFVKRFLSKPIRNLPKKIQDLLKTAKAEKAAKIHPRNKYREAIKDHLDVFNGTPNENLPEKEKEDILLTMQLINEGILKMPPEWRDLDQGKDLFDDDDEGKKS